MRAAAASVSGRSEAAATTASGDSSRASVLAAQRERRPSSSGDPSLTTERLRVHTSGGVLEDDQEGSGGESADVFGDIGGNVLPWRRSTPDTSAARRPMRVLRARELDPGPSTADSDDINDLKKTVYDNYSAREELLQSSYNGARYFMTESYLETELSRYELLMKELTDNSVLKSVDQIDVKLKSTPWDDSATGSLNVQAARDERIAAVKITWLLKSLKAGEDFHRKSNLVRSMFRRTNAFFDELNAMELSYMTKKHLRELGKRRMLQRLRTRTPGDETFRERLDALEISQHREVQHVEVRNLKELYIRTLQKEWGGLDSHLSMLEELFNTLYRIYIEVLNMKIAGINEWCLFRSRQDADARDAVRHIREQCVSEFRSFKERDRVSEMNVVKREAEEDRERRKSQFGGTSSALSSELVFNMNVSSRNKNLYVLDDTSSAGTFDMDDGDVEGVATAHNKAFLSLIKLRVARKVALEAKFNEQLDREVESRQKGEQLHLESARRHEREHLKTAMRRYFAEEAALEEKIKDFLSHEKNAVEQLKSKQESEMESLLDAQGVEVDNFEREAALTAAVAALPGVGGGDGGGGGAGRDRNEDTMLTTHCFHELRNVLASILCLGENLKEDPGSIEAIVEEQGDVCTYALDTMNDMLSIARLKEPAFRCTRAPMAVDELFDAVIRIQGRRAGRGVAVVKIVEVEGLMILSDKKLLLQLFVNLLSNASKFTTSGTIALCASRQRSGDEHDDDDAASAAADGQGGGSRIRIGIADTGPGIENMPRSGLRDLSTVQGFVETHSEMSGDLSDYKGSGYKVRNTGYGLYLASTVATALGTRLRVRSPVGSAPEGMTRVSGKPGSFFYLHQPEYVVPTSPVPAAALLAIAAASASASASASAAVASAAAVAAAAAAAPEGEGEEGAGKRWRFAPSGFMRVLVVDDQKLLRQTMLLLLKKLCEGGRSLVLHVETACCAEEALRRHRAAPFDLISMDQYYDQVLLSRLPSAQDAVAPSLRLEGGDPEGNRKAYIEFKARECFGINSGDGQLVGTDVIRSMRAGADKPMVFSCTASDDVAGAALDKPYTLEKFQGLMEREMHRYLSEGGVTLDGQKLRRSPELVLYEMS